MAMPAETRLIPCLTDNYAVLLRDPASGAVAVVDAPEAAPILDALDREGWRLTHILVTHHHRDHTDGIPALVERFAPEVIVPATEAERIPHAGRGVKEGDTVGVGSLTARVLDTPGHTNGHISYVFDAERLLFAGDTLFALGCGRVIEGTPAMMWASLDKLRQLPDDMRVYCGHEYTQSNARFALSIDRDNPALAARATAVDRTVAAKQPTIPSLIGEERATNPFLRVDDGRLAAAVGLTGASPTAVFADIRGRKDRF
jgi:hydroxyacylglutathione hydrolase